MTGGPGRLIVDASVVLKWVLPEPDRDEAVRLLDAYEAEEADLIAPRVLMEEVGSALSKRCRRKELSESQARKAWHLIEIRQPLLVDEPALLPTALDLSLDYQLSFWDSLYLALAIAERCDLITADQRFYNAGRRHYPFFRLLGKR